MPVLFGLISRIVFGFQIPVGMSRFKLMKVKVLLIALGVSLSMNSCSQRSDKVVHSGRPSIYDAWDARYSYNIEKRQMIPFHEGVPSGRMWGRDPSGKIDQASYFSKNKQSQEDLFALHSKKLDREREKKWEQSKEKRINFIQEQIEILKSEEDAPFIEVEIEEEEDDFVPPAFIPQGIDLNNNDAPMEDAPVGDEPPAFPFAPLP
jgi:hypothetical protein